MVGQIQEVSRVSEEATALISLMVEDMNTAAEEMRRPSVLFRPALSSQGEQWIALYGTDAARGIAGFGATPDEAMRDFDQKWVTSKAVAPPKQEDTRSLQQITEDFYENTMRREDPSMRSWALLPPAEKEHWYNTVQQYYPDAVRA